MKILKNKQGDEVVFVGGQWRTYKDGNVYNAQDNSWFPMGDDREPVAEEAEEGYLSQLVGNLPRSGAQLVGDLAQPFMHPVETGGAIADLVEGGASKVLDLGWPEEKNVDAVGDFYSDRYGGWDEAANSLKEDPLGVLSDAAGLVTGGASMAAKIPGMAGKMSKLGKVAAALDPANAIVNTGIKGGAGAAKFLNDRFDMGTTPTKLTESALKFSTSKYNDAERAAMYRTVLDEGLLPRGKDVDLMGTRISDLGSQVDEVIGALPETMVTPRASLLDGLDDVAAKYGDTTLDPTGNRNRVARVGSKFMTTPDVLDDTGKLIEGAVPADLTPMQVQNLKKQAYEDINFRSKNLKTNALATEAAQKQIASNARTRIEALSPEVHDINKRLGGLLELRTPFEQSTARIGNRDKIGIGVPIKVAAGEALTPGAGMVGGAIGMLDTPMIKARTAQLMNRLGKQDYVGQLMASNTKRGMLSREAMNIIADQRERESQGLLDY